MKDLTSNAGEVGNCAPGNGRAAGDVVLHEGRGCKRMDLPLPWPGVVEHQLPCRGMGRRAGQFAAHSQVARTATAQAEQAAQRKMRVIIWTCGPHGFASVCALRARSRVSGKCRAYATKKAARRFVAAPRAATCRCHQPPHHFGRNAWRPFA